MRTRGHLDNPAAQDRLRKRQKLAVLQAELDLHAVMELPAGRRFLYGLVHGRCGVMSSTFSADSHANSYTEGRRSVGVELLVDLQVKEPQLYVQMISEAIESEANEQIHKSSAEAEPEPGAEPPAEETGNGD